MDAETGVIRVPRVVGVVDVGRVVNPRKSRSELLGGIIAGPGGALTEEGYFHPANGRSAIRNLADYHIPRAPTSRPSPLRHRTSPTRP